MNGVTSTASLITFYLSTGFRLPVCRQDCGAAKRIHYHCCICHCVILKQTDVREHVNHCLEEQQEQQNKSHTLLKTTPEKYTKTVIQSNSATAMLLSQKSKDEENARKKFVRRDTPSGLEAIPLSSEEVEKYYALEPCHGCSLGCTGMRDQVHCPFCSVDKFKPTRKVKVLAHITAAHCHNHRPSVVYKGELTIWQRKYVP